MSTRDDLKSVLVCAMTEAKHTRAAERCLNVD